MDTEAQDARSKDIANADLARRSRLAALVYLSLFAIILAFTPYPRDHTLVASLVGAIIAGCAGWRAWLIFRFEDCYTQAPDLWFRQFTGLTLLLAATWGLFCAHAVLRYDLTWTAMLTLLSTAGISAGAITTLSIHKKLILTYLALLLFPAIAAALVHHSPQSYAVALMFITYCVFLFSVAGNIHKEYWQALNNALLLSVRARQLEASNRELESYSYSIAHDLRAPLRSIIGFSQILEEDLAPSLTADQRSNLNRVINAGQRMAGLIDDILELSRITRRELIYQNIDLSALLQDLADALVVSEPQRDVHIDIQKGIQVRGDVRLLSIAMQNLLENAWKFSRQEEGARIDFKSTQHGQDTVYSVCDNGVGFDMAHAGKLFQPFERLHPGRTFPGTGIGLATAQRIIQRHGGRIWAESAPGDGACFFFTLH